MSLAWLFPLGLAALAAWLVPLLVHLRRRSEQQRTVFAALQWLATRARPRSRLRFEEWPLLLVRLLLLAALAVLLAQPVLFGAPHAKQWVVVAAGIDRSALPARAEHVEYRWLAPGFPRLEDDSPATPQPTASLLRELDATLPADVAVSVYVPDPLDGADAVRPRLSRPVQWHAVRRDGSDAVAPPDTAPRPALAVRHDAGHADAVRYLRAAAVAWQSDATAPHSANAPAADIGPLAQSLPATGTPLVWLGQGALPAPLLQWVERGGSVLVGVDSEVSDIPRLGIALWHDDAGNVLARGIARGRGRVLQLAAPLRPDALPLLLQPEFPEHLWRLFAPAPPAPTRIAASDYAPRTGAPEWPAIPLDLASWLVLLVAALFLLERWLASGRRDAVSAEARA